MEDTSRKPQPPNLNKRLRSPSGGRDETLNRKRRCKSSIINIGAAFALWRQVKKEMDIQTDQEMAAYLLEGYLGPKPQDPVPELLTMQSEGSSSEIPKTLTGVCHPYGDRVLPESTPTDHPPAAREFSTNETDNGRDVDDTSQLTQDSKELRANRTESKSIQVSPDLLCVSTSVDDGPYLVDLNNSSQHIVDEACIIKMLRTCLKCNEPCTVRKCVRGLHLIVYQSCYFCHCHFKWSSQVDSDVLIYGKYASLQYHHSRVKFDRTTASRDPPKLT